MNLNTTALYLSWIFYLLGILANQNSRFIINPPVKTTAYVFYSHYNNNTKRGIVIGFYLKALRICTTKHLNDEFIHIENSFLNLLYPKSFIHFTKSKALKIHNKNQPQTNAHTQSDKTSSPHRFITLPNNYSSHSITNNLNKLNIKTTSLPSKTIRELVHSSPQRNIFSDTSPL